MQRYIRSLGAAAAIVIALGACAPAIGGAGAGRSDVQRDDQVRLVLTNHNWADVAVYLIRGGSRVRLGDVPSMSERVLMVPRAMLGASTNVRLLIDPIGSRHVHVTDPIFVSPGQVIEMAVENNLALTNWSVW